MFTLRPATGHDINAVDRLLSRAYPRLMAGDYAPSVLDLALPRISRAQPDLVSSGTYYLIEKEGVLLGAGGWTAAAPGGGSVTPGLGHIRHVVTDDRAVRRGVARALMGHIVNQSRAKGMHRLRCFSTLTAEPFYAAVGFDRLRLITIPLGDGIEFPAIEMERVL